MGVSFGELVNSGAEPLRTSEFIAPAKEISFAEIVCAEGGSIENSEFAKHFCAKQMLTLPSCYRTRFEHLLTWEKINELLSLNVFEEPAMRVTRDGRDVPPSLYRGSDGQVELVSSAKLHDLVKQNASVALNWIQISLRPSVGSPIRSKLRSGRKSGSIAT